MRKNRRHILVLAGVVALGLVIARTNNVDSTRAASAADAPAVVSPTSPSDEGLLQASVHSPVLSITPQGNGSILGSNDEAAGSPGTVAPTSDVAPTAGGPGWRDIAADVRNVGNNVQAVGSDVSVETATASPASASPATNSRTAAQSGTSGVGTSAEVGWRAIADNLEVLAQDSSQGASLADTPGAPTSSPRHDEATWHTTGTAVLTSTAVSEQVYLRQLSVFYIAVRAQTEARFFAALQAQQIAAQQAAQQAAQLAAQQAAQQALIARERASAAAAPSTPTPASSSGGYAGGVWAALRQCESGGNYAEDTGNGFYGAYQFLPSTWRGLGYPGMPNQAPPAMQDAAAAQLQARSGWGQWPECARKLGLL